jgi:Flp pilus assembly protein TadG
MLQKSKRRRGTIAVLVAISLIPLLGIVAIVCDGGLLMDQRRRVQAAADAAALAAATDLFANYRTNAGTDPKGTANKSALHNASANGYNNDGVTNTVAVNIPPTWGSYANKPGYAEVIITYYQPRGFSNIFGSGNIPVTARAVARGRYVAGSVGVLILDPSSTDTCEINGTLNIQGSGDITVNSSDPAAVQLYNSGSITATNLNIVGYPGVQNNVGTQAVNATVNTGITAAADPLAGIAEPTPSGTNYGAVNCTGNATLQPGQYTSITVANNANVTMQPGIYYLSGPSTSGSYGGLFPWGPVGRHFDGQRSHPDGRRRHDLQRLRR